MNPRDFLSLEDAVKQSQQAQAAPQPQAGGYVPQYVGNEAYSTTVMPETGAPGPNYSLAGNRNYATLNTANDMAKLYGGRVLQANMAQGPTRTNAAQYAIDFGVGDPLNAGQLAARYDTSDPNRDKFWDSPYWRDKAVQDELNYASKYIPASAQVPRGKDSFEGPANNPQYQWHTPQGGANYLQGGQSPFAKAKLSVSQGAGIGMPAARPQPPSTQAAPTAQMNAPRTAMPAASMYGRRPTAAPQSSPYGAMRRTAAPQQSAAPQSGGLITTAYRAPGTRTF